MLVSCVVVLNVGMLCVLFDYFVLSSLPHGGLLNLKIDSQVQVQVEITTLNNANVCIIILKGWCT